MLRMTRLFVLPLVLLALLSVHGRKASAQFPYARTVWRISDGLPEDTVQAMAESRDGLLWIGTTGGLAHFDGFRIQDAGMQEEGLASTQQVKRNSIFSLAFASDGSLWAGTEGGGLLHLQQGREQGYSVRQALTDAFVRSVYIDRAGVVWAGTDDGLFAVKPERPDGESIRRVDRTSEIPSLAIHSILQDNAGNIWAGGSRLIQIKPDGLTREFRLPGAYSKNRVKKLLQTRDGTLWVGTVSGLQRLRRGQFEAVPGLHATVRSLLETSDGSLWIGTIGEGLWMFRNEHLTRVSRDGLLPSDTVLSMIEDDHQQIWVGTQAGLVRLARSPVSVVPLPEGGDPDLETISGDKSGNIWVAAQHLYLLHNGVARRVSYGGLTNINVRNAFRASNGDLWLGTDGAGAYRIRAGKATHFTAPTALTNNFIRGFLESHDGSIWIATDEGVSQINGDGIRRLTVADGLAFFSTRSLLEDHDHNLWIGTDHGLSLWKNGSFHDDAATVALASEKIWSILEDQQKTLWFGTRDHGLYRYRAGHLQQFTTEQGLISNSVYQLLEDRQRTFWISGPNSIGSVAESEMDGPAPSAGQPLRVEVYSMPFSADGAQIYGGRQPAGYLAPDDSVWFATTRGAARIAHAQAPGDSVPKATLRSFLQDGRTVPITASARIPARIARLSFVFTAVSLTAQNGVRFRYRLDNFDRGWSNAPVDRLATYTNLPAGDYTFRVIAFNASNPAAFTEVDFPFVKVAFFYQTRWFYSLVLASLLLVAWGIYQLRVRQIQTRFSAVLAERSRMAREMHDTVIQGCTSISALLEAMATLPVTVPAPEPSQELLEHARTQARATINEARHAVWNMRHEQEKEVDLIDALEKMAQQTTFESGMPVAFTHTVERFGIASSVAHEVLMMVREAVYNSVQHSGALQITIDLETIGRDLQVIVADSGRGFDRDEAQLAREGHYGIKGMRERMERIGGELVLTSRINSGTVVRLHVHRAAEAIRRMEIGV